MREKRTFALTPEHLRRLLGLPDDVVLAGVSASRSPAAIHMSWYGPEPDGWTPPAVLDGVPAWVPGQPIVDCYSVFHRWEDGTLAWPEGPAVTPDLDGGLVTSRGFSYTFTDTTVSPERFREASRREQT